MAEKELLLLMRNTLIPKVQESLESLPDSALKPLIRRLVNPSDRVQLSELEPLEESLRNSETAEPAASAIYFLIAAWYLVNSCHLTDYKLSVANKCFEYLQRLQGRSDFDIEVIASEVSAQFIFGVMSAENFDELIDWMLTLKRFQAAKYGTCENPMKMSEIKLQTITWQNFSVEDFAKMLQIMGKLKTVTEEMPLAFNLDDLTAILGELMVNYVQVHVEDSEKLEELKCGVTEMNAFGFTSERVLGKLQQLTERIGVNEMVGEEVEMHLSVDYTSLINSKALYSQSQLAGFGDVQSWGELEKERVDPLHYARRGPLEVIVYKAKIKKTGTLVAVKSYKAEKLESLNIFHTEIKYLHDLSNLRMASFLQFYGAFADEVTEGEGPMMARLNIVMEFCGTVLIDEIEEKKQANTPYSEEEFTNALVQLIEGFATLESKKIYHQDVKPHNLFITEQRNYKIADFNVSKTADPTLNTFTTMSHTIQGTDGYFSPELQVAWNEHKRNNGPRITKHHPNKSDMYSLGMTLLQMATLKSVLGLNSAERQADLNSRIAELPYREELKNVLRAMLEYNPVKRSIFKQIKAMLPGQATV